MYVRFSGSHNIQYSSTCGSEWATFGRTGRTEGKGVVWNGAGSFPATRKAEALHIVLRLRLANSEMGQFLASSLLYPRRPLLTACGTIRRGAFGSAARIGRWLGMSPFPFDYNQITAP